MLKDELQAAKFPKKTNPTFAILIATRNRPRELHKLLSSITQLLVGPSLVVIVSSGEDISSSLVGRYSLNIIHKHILDYGQIRQKMIGISEIPREIDWVLFLDDDLILDRTTTKELLNFLRVNNNDDIIGLGLSDSSVVKQKKQILRIGPRLGAVSISGHNNNYMQSEIPVATSWLNGASMWKRSKLDYYKFEYLDARYSICEDLIYSYAMSKLGTLYYVPAAKFHFQVDSQNHSSEIQVFRARAYWKFYFVSMFPELSKSLFLLHTLPATIAFTLKRQTSTNSLFERFQVGFTVYFDLVTSYITRRDPLDLLKQREI
jgi:GT2 family glycosyltransferase